MLFIKNCRYSDEETLEECDMESSISEHNHAKTGLTQSAQNLSSENISYGYTIQSDYEGGPRGYSETITTTNSPQKNFLIPTTISTKPKITSAIYKNKTMDMDDPLLSDVFVTNNGTTALSNGLDDDDNDDATWNGSNL